ncbi:MAG: hypothetical protein STHCBS139747_007643 [Sporothrix thermara]
MEPFSTSKVSVEYHDPHGLYRLLAPGLAARLPLRHLHWQSHSGPLRSIDTLHVEMVPAESNPHAPPATLASSTFAQKLSEPTAADDGFQTATVGRPGSVESASTNPHATGTTAAAPAPSRRHQIPGLRRTPYLKLLLVRCDDTDTYKAQTRAEIKDWIKKNAMPEKSSSGGGGSSSSSSKKASGVRENHDAYEWMIVHIVLPGSAAFSQPRTSKGSSDGSDPASASKSTTLWGKNTSTLLERMRSDFNAEPSSKSGGAIVDRVAQIRVSAKDVPYDLQPKVASAPASAVQAPGISATENEAAWADVVDKLKSRILASFDVRVSQYEEDIREKDVQRTLPGWNFCTFFILKEGLARGFESVGLVEDALVGYDELSVGLDTVLQEQASLAGSTLLKFTDELKEYALKALKTLKTLKGGDETSDDDDDEDEEAGGDDSDETVDLQAASRHESRNSMSMPPLPISSTNKFYRELILSNNVSVFDFRCYVFARQVALLLRLGNAATDTRDELLSKMREQTSTEIAPSSQTAPTIPASSSSDSHTPENLSMLAEICRRTIDFLPAVSQVMREDLLFALAGDNEPLPPSSLHVIDNMVASFAFSVAQQILAQTSTRALPIPLAMTMTQTLDGSSGASEPKASIPEPKTMMHPARTSSLNVRAPQGRPPPPSPGIFPGPGQPQSSDDAEHTRFLKMGLEELAARRADLYLLSRNILQKGGEKCGWSDGWSAAPIVDSSDDLAGMEDVSLDDDDQPATKPGPVHHGAGSSSPVPVGVDNLLLRTALESRTGFFRLYEALTDKAVRHYTVAGYAHAVRANFADLAVLKYHLQDYAAAVYYFYETTHFFGESSWDQLETSMLLMCAQCLKELGRQDEYARWLLQFLAKVADAERQRREQQVGRLVAGHSQPPPAPSSVRGRLADLLEASASVSDMRVPLTSFFRAMNVEGPPVFADGQDRFSLTLRLDSLLVDPLPVDSVKVRLSQPSTRGRREIWLETDSSSDKCVLGPDRGTVQLHSNTIVPGLYEIDQVRIAAKGLVIFHDRQPTLTSTSSSAASTALSSTPTSAILPDPHVVLYQRTDALDIQLTTCKDLQLDKNNSLDLALMTGWNDIQHCEMRIRAATGGLRLLTTEAKVVGGKHAFAKRVESGIVRFDNVPANTSLHITFPFSIEQDVLELCLKVDVTYTTASGTYYFSKSPSVSTSLALGVNVQDVFKHDTLFSRFTVSTATASPLRVFRSELLESDLFTARLGGRAESDDIDHSTSLPVVFPKQPVSLLYRITRKRASLRAPPSARKTAQRTMYIKLHYSVFQDQLDVALEASLSAAFRASAGLEQFAKLAVACVLRHVHASLTPYDLEKMALLHEMQTSVLGHVHWAKEFPGLRTPAADIAAVIYAWQKENPVLFITGDPAPDRIRTILIPVDIPSITIVHTADIQLQGPFESAVAVDTFEGEDGKDGKDGAVGVPIFCVNQLLSATLHLRWTRVWDTSNTAPQDLEFSFEVSAPNDAWLIGGRRKGHFVIPAPDDVAADDPAVSATATDGDVDDDDDGEAVVEGVIGLNSTPALEAAIPLMLIPLREGRLPYPSVEIREVVPSADGQDAAAAAAPADAHHCETDYRNLGETVHVMADRTRLTLSLDASGPGGGPLVLESERACVDGRIVV